MLKSNVEFHVLCVEVGLDLGCHVVTGVVLGFTTQTQYQIQSSFLLNFVVQLCTCAVVVRLYSVIVNFICSQLLHTFESRKRVIRGVSLHIQKVGRTVLLSSQVFRCVYLITSSVSRYCIIRVSCSMFEPEDPYLIGEHCIQAWISSFSTLLNMKWHKSMSVANEMFCFFPCIIDHLWFTDELFLVCHAGIFSLSLQTFQSGAKE